MNNHWESVATGGFTATCVWIIFSYALYCSSIAPVALYVWGIREGYQILEQRNANFSDWRSFSRPNATVIYHVVLQGKWGGPREALVRVRQRFFWTYLAEHCAVEVRWIDGKAGQPATTNAPGQHPMYDQDVQ